LFGTGVKNFSFAFPQEKQYERRFKVLGIENHKQKTLGCFKYDMPTSVESKEQLRKKYGIPPNRDLIVFGSTHPGEEDQILDALEPLWGDIGSTIVIAPRHLKRVPEIEQILKQRNLDFSRVSKKNATAGHIILVDTLGDLVNLYSLASLAFVGGSLIERGGHNLMEPAAFGVPILTGPHTFNFRYEMMALKRKRAVKVTKNSLELQNAIEDWLKNKESFEAMGCRAKELLQSMSGASHRTIESLQEAGLLPNGQSGNH
jgi:3-deoxy-D-manno-octulosonic-acid transferase